MRISAVYGETAFSLVPFHFIGAYKISNPGLPDISFASVTTTSISLSHNFLSQNIGPYNFLYTPQIDAGSKVFKTSDFNIVDLTVNKSDDLIETEKWSGPSFSNSVAAISRRPLIPSASLRVLNLTNKEPCEACRNGQIRIPDEAAPSAVATIGTFQNLGYGTIWGGYAAKFNGLTKRFDPATSNLAAIYRIGALDTFFTLAPSLTSFGFMFDSTYYRIGIQYTDEKQENSLFIPRRKFSYVHVALRI